MAKKTARYKATPKAGSRASRTSTRQPADTAPVRLLSGGNPQIPKGYGDAPVRAYLAAMPCWKRAAGEMIDAIITRTVPRLRKAVKWNSPLYGAGEEDRGWFLSFHCFDKYIKIAFHRGTSLRPPPPEGSKQPDIRYLHVTEAWGTDEDQRAFTEWVRQAAALPGERM